MKIYSISKLAFRGICILILLLPVSRHWRLLVNGTRVQGEVGEYTQLIREVGKDRHIIEYASAVRFTTGDQEYSAFGPKNYEYQPGRSLTVIYEPANPDNNCILSFTGFYLTNYTALPIILLVVWYAFFLSFNNYSRKKKISAQKTSTQEKSGQRFVHLMANKRRQKN
jgi:hypothetical protein